MTNLIDTLVFLVKALGLLFVIVLLIGLLITTISVILEGNSERNARKKMIKLINNLSDEEIEDIVRKTIMEELNKK